MLAYKHIGTGKDTIAFIHGFCENNTCFNEQVLLLKDRYKLLLIDLAGFGNSAHVSANTIVQMAEQAHEVILSLKLSNLIMLGHSMGGYVTLEFANKYDSLLRGFGLIHSTASADNEERIKKRNQAINFINENGTAAYVKPFIPPLFAPEYKNKNRVDELINEALKIPPVGLTNALAAMRDRSAHIELLKTTALPVLFIAGENDSIIPASDMALQASLCKQSFFHALQNSGHMGQVEEASTCARIIDDFVKSM